MCFAQFRVVIQTGCRILMGNLKARKKVRRWGTCS